MKENHAEPLQNLKESLQQQQVQALAGIEREKAKPILYQAKKVCFFCLLLNTILLFSASPIVQCTFSGHSFAFLVNIK